MKSWQEITPVGNRIMPKGQKAYRRGEAPVYEKYQIHSPNGAAEIMEIIINFFHPFGAKFLSSCKWGCVVLLLRGLHPLLYADSPSGLKLVLDSDRGKV